MSGQIRSAFEWCHWIGLDKDINRYSFVIFLILLWNIKKKFQSLEPLHTKMPPTSCFFSTRFVLNPFFLWAGALLFDK
jgi:hypothetical protein